MSSNGKRKWKAHSNFQENRKRRKKFVLETGMKGFLCTCNVKERDCVKEAYNVLNDYADRIYGEEKVNKSDSSPKEIEDELEDEVELLKAEREQGTVRRFQAVNSGANNCIFIKTTVPDPVELAYSIMKDISETNQQKTRHLIRLVPIEVTCKADLDEIKRECQTLFERHFKCEPTTYAVVYNKRYNDKFLRDETIESVARLVQDRNILHKVDLKNAQKTIVVEIIKNLCCLSVVPDYFLMKKYNLIELCKKEENNQKDCKSESVEVKKDNDDTTANEEDPKVKQN